MLTVGCSAPDGPAAWSVSSTEYERAFDAAINALREGGYVTAVRDRTGGVIETEPQRVGGTLEPWEAADQSWSITGESTLALQRRRARVEFAAAGAEAPTATVDDRLGGPDVVGAATPDLRTATGAIEVRVWVALERAHTPGIRRFAWTRSLTTRTVNPAEPIDPADGVVATSIWTPIGRDEDAERRIADRIRTALERSAPDEAAPDRG